MENNSVFWEFKEKCLNGYYKTPFQIPPSYWGLHEWDTLSEDEVMNMLFPFIKFQLKRAKNSMEIYKNAYKDIDIDSINNMDDFNNKIPLLVKDSTIENIGFRGKVRENPYVLRPNDIKDPMYIYKSGGTKGVATPTFITKNDLIRESHSFARSFYYEGIRPGDVALSTYNPTHKGGEAIKEGLMLNGVTFIPIRTNETAEDIIKVIKDYNVNVLLTVQGDVLKGAQESKDAGVDFMSLVEAGQDVLEKNIKTLFLGGYKLIDEATAWANTFEKPLVNAYGACEALVLATNTPSNGVNLCKHNNFHLMYGPHIVEIVRYENGKLVQCKKGETGMVAITTIAREGTIYIRYLIGDKATVVADEGECSCGIKSKIISNLSRIDNPQDLISSGCMCTMG
jgi:Coenzyme F390 synthetase